MKNMMKRMASLVCALFLLVSLFPTVGYAEEESEQQTQQGSCVIVSLGDSYSSGEGNPDYYGSELSLDKKVKSQDWLSHRSANSWPGQLTLNIDGVTTKMASKRDTYWYFAAVSGAKTSHLLKENQTKSYKKGDYQRDNVPIDVQMKVFEQVAADGRVAEYVTVTIGGNDADFSNVVQEGFWSSFGCPSIIDDKLNSVWREFYKEEGIRSNILKSYYGIHQNAGEQAKIIVAGYPPLITPKMSWYFSEYVAKNINDSVSRFNQEIEAIVNTCKADGIKICFVSVESAFRTHEAYSSDPFIHPIILGKLPGTIGVSKEKLAAIREEELVDGEMISMASMHPNEKGIEVYRDCVQRKIDEIESKGDDVMWPEATKSNELDVALVLDVSGSMDGEPLRETIKAATSFVDTVLTEESSVGVVAYDTTAMMVCNSTKNGEYAKGTITNLNAGGSTNIDAGLQMAEQMLLQGNAKKKIIVLMSDGEPNEGRADEELIAYADEIKSKGISIYTLGFFHYSYGSSYAQSLMQALASEGCHYEVDDADNLVYFFGDIADQVQGTKYIYVRIACPVDVRVEYNGEVLESKYAESSQRTSFGTLTFEENSEHYADSTDNRIKVLRLRDGAKYDIRIEGNGTGQMTYSIGFMNEEGEYQDVREFTDVAINPDTVVDTVAERTRTTTLNVDNDGDGEYDETLKKSGEGYGSGGGGGVADDTDIGVILLWVGIGVGVLAAVGVIVFLRIKSKKRSAADDTESTVEECADLEVAVQDIPDMSAVDIAVDDTEEPDTTE